MTFHPVPKINLCKSKEEEGSFQTYFMSFSHWRSQEHLGQEWSLWRTQDDVVKVYFLKYANACMTSKSSHGSLIFCG